MSKKEILAYSIVAILAITLTFLFLKVFAFEDKKDEVVDNHPKITEELIKNCYDLIPDYKYYFNKYPNLTQGIISNTLYKYILKNQKEILKESTIDDIKNNNLIGFNENESNFKPLYKINQDDFTAASKYAFGIDSTKVPHTSFTIDDVTRAYYSEEGYYLIYEKNIPIENNFIEKREYERYQISDNGDTLIIYDRYVKCNKTTNNCYNDSDANTMNSNIKIVNNDIDLANHLKEAQEYKHTFKFTDGYYYWYSTEQTK